ncbi:MAG: UDP-N-acetylglucosamine--LPS N-acetylglucosamine transferase [Paenibacillus sp.]|uniref:MGDG synthase family glycosyltransferase n=1 Tax=Paenibacillus sp. TaxID=58172 RepID=UPI0025EA9A96|nr:glycosyltransferase [Paenibacillus sp.]MBR2566465.1 UDP-N-acetylglucosamine--LPS N-acetylglucosamine transferase [Paenibacillus sp.]
MEKKRILLLSEGFGAGHTQAAYALSSHLRKLSPNIQTKVLELGSFLNPKVAPLIINAYRKTVTTQPKLVGYMYKQQYKKPLNRLTTLALHKLFYTHTRSVVRQLNPSAIVCTHPIPSAVISRLKRLGTKVPLCNVLTDYDAHGTWISQEVDLYLVSSDEVKGKLMLRGIAEEKIKVTGIPVHPNFWEHPGHDEVRTRFNLKNMPTVLVMGGGWGMLNDKVLHQLLAGWHENIQIIFCLGRNDKVRHSMEQDPLFQQENIHIIGYTTEVDKLMEVSDLLITKPGGITCSEGLAKGIPMLFHNPIPGQEEENVHYFTARGLGELITSVDVVVKWMNKLLYYYPDVVKKRERHLSDIAKVHPMESAQCIMNLLQNIQPLSSEETHV